MLAMSGGVDSSVAGYLLTLQGYDVVGVFMRHGESTSNSCESEANDRGLAIISPSNSRGCCTASDAADAQRVADDLDIPFYALNLREEFQQIIDYFVNDYARGRTPNPCVMCNNILKFGKLFQYADSVGARYVATGHYARLSDDGRGGISLHRGRDRAKDQSYVLFGVERSLLSRMLLPVGGFQKPEIRKLAVEYGLSVSNKPDSQDICFVASGEHASFVAQRTNEDTGGEMVTSDGSVVGRHDGIEAFTVGQRKGLGVAMGEPFFVLRIDAATNQVVIGRKEELACRWLSATNVNWLVDDVGRPFRCDVQIRYNSPATPALVTPLENGRMEVQFDEPCFGVAPGQAAVAYLEDRVVGGGWIDETA